MSGAAEIARTPRRLFSQEKRRVDRARKENSTCFEAEKKPERKMIKYQEGGGKDESQFA